MSKEYKYNFNLEKDGNSVLKMKLKHISKIKSIEDLKKYFVDLKVVGDLNNFQLFCTGNNRQIGCYKKINGWKMNSIQLEKMEDGRWLTF